LNRNCGEGSVALLFSKKQKKTEKTAERAEQQYRMFDQLFQSLRMGKLDVAARRSNFYAQPVAAPAQTSFSISFDLDFAARQVGHTLSLAAGKSSEKSVNELFHFCQRAGVKLCA